MGELDTKVEKAAWGWMVMCRVCKRTDGFEARSSGSGALRKAKAWRCPQRTCNEIIRLRIALRARGDLAGQMVGCGFEDRFGHHYRVVPAKVFDAVLRALRTDSAPSSEKATP